MIKVTVKRLPYRPCTLRVTRNTRRVLFFEKGAMSEGWIKLHRKFLNWEWWQDHNTARLFMTLLLLANHEDNKWRGVTILRGQLVTGLHSLSETSGLSIQSIRTSLAKLKSTNEITIKPTNQFSIITICNYNTYQSAPLPEQQADQLATQQTINTRPTNEQQQTRMIKKDKNEKKISSASEIPLVQYGKHLRMTAEEMAALILKHGKEVVDLESTSADTWIEKSQKRSATDYRKPTWNHFLFFGGWLTRATPASGSSPSANGSGYHKPDAQPYRYSNYSSVLDTEEK